MKKQGDLYLKIVSIVLAGIVVAYLVLSVLFGSGGSSYTLETAVRCEAGDGQPVSGFVVREEEIITASQPVVVCALTEGERVGSGQRVADGYQTSAARETRDRLTALQEQLSQLRYAASGTAGEDTTQTDDAIEKALGELAALTARRDLTEADDVMSELQPLVLRRSVTADDAARMEGRIAELESQISALSAETEQSAEAVTVESAGYFSERTDGLERVLTPESVLQMKPSELRAAAQHASAVPGNAVGRLITGQKWYFAAEIPEARAEQTAAGETLTVSFGLEKLSQIRMQVEAISEAEDGVCTIVLSCEREPQEVTALRRQSADIIFSSYTGLRVPKQALYMVDGQAGVYVLEGARARWKPVEILYAYGDGYVVELDQSSTGNLWPGDDIILTSDDIEDGKVMEA